MAQEKKQKAVLVVEDDNELALVVVNTLNNAGYEASSVSTTRDASFKLASTKFACILVDMNLGKDSGENVIHIARNPKVSENSRTPIVMMSGTLDKESLVRIAPFIKGVLVKPFGVEALLEHVVKLCGAA